LDRLWVVGRIGDLVQERSNLVGIEGALLRLRLGLLGGIGGRF
jgi:hypothetical protein